MTGEEIRARLSAFAAKWSLYQGTERAEAQTFLNELFDCYGVGRETVAGFEVHQGGGFVDLLWPGRCLFEMKAPGEARRLSHHRRQALDYWRESADPGAGVPAARYVVLCAFHAFEVWEPGLFPTEPRTAFSLAELPDAYDALLFLAGDTPVFQGGQAAVTVNAVRRLGSLNAMLADRRVGGPDERRDFLLQTVWCMFAEDLGQIPGHRFTRVLEGLIANPDRSSADDLGRFFEYLDDPSPQRPEHGMYAGTPYANGALFRRPARLHLVREELEVLRAACEQNWREVQPQIFGNLLEGALGHDRQWEVGAHYTHEPEIQKIVQPTIVRPWRERIENLETPAEAAQAQADLMGYVVLDPACGCGNFLYVAYRELRRIERRLADRLSELRRAAGQPAPESLALFFPLANIRGIEIERFAVALARVTLWMGHRLAVEELGLDESTLPLADLSGIVVQDALRHPWPRADAIIGNPPYHGSQHLRGIYGAEYLEWLGEEFGCGVQDLCVYWFRKAADRLERGGRAGLVGTNSISQNRARGASLNYVVEHGGVITDAVSRQRWPGEAVVNVSIVNWVKQPAEPPARFVLDGREVAGISTRLHESLVPVEEFAPLPANAGRAFQGPIPAGSFYLEPGEARGLLDRGDASYAEVVRPYLVGDDITEDPFQEPRRWIVDFAAMPLEAAMAYPAALDLVRERVKPERETNNDANFRRYWWRFGRPRGEMREAIAPLRRYIAGNAQGKRFLFCWADLGTCPSNLTNVFAFDDDYAMGVLTSSAHQAWARAEASTLRVDLRYTPTSCFATFPWPQPPSAVRDEIGRLAAALLAARTAICVDREIGLTELYNEVDEGAWTEVRDAHAALDAAVAAAYGWPAAVAADPLELRARLAALHARIQAGELTYAPFFTD
ncbi:MAG: type IIL restriction-modification enzyme MmeI [Solirubrobacteraceae bacterium]